MHDDQVQVVDAPPLDRRQKQHIEEVAYGRRFLNEIRQDVIEAQHAGRNLEGRDFGPIGASLLDLIDDLDINFGLVNPMENRGMINALQVAYNRHLRIVNASSDTTIIPGLFYFDRLKTIYDVYVRVVSFGFDDDGVVDKVMLDWAVPQYSTLIEDRLQEQIRICCPRMRSFAQTFEADARAASPTGELTPADGDILLTIGDLEVCYRAFKTVGETPTIVTPELLASHARVWDLFCDPIRDERARPLLDIANYYMDIIFYPTSPTDPDATIEHSLIRGSLAYIFPPMEQ